MDIFDIISLKNRAQLGENAKQIQQFVYNLDEGLRVWKRNRNKNTNLVFLGDSITASTGATTFDTGFVNLVKQALQLQHGITGYGFQGYKGFITSGWTQASKGTNLCQWMGTPASNDITIKEYFNEIDIIYSTEPDGGTLTINIDGGDYTVNCNGAESFHNINTRNFGLNNGLHTLIVKKPTTGNVYIEGIVFKSNPYPYTSNQMLVHNVGHPGIRANDYLNNPSAIKASIADFNPSLTIIMLGTNDSGGQISLVNYKLALTQLVQSGLQSGSVMIMAMGNSQDGDTYAIKFSDYVKAMREVAVEQNCAFLSIFDLWNKQYLSSLMLDNVHPNQLGHSAIADAIISCIGGTKSQLLSISNNPYGRLIISSDNTLPILINLGERKDAVAVTQGVTQMTINLSNNRLSSASDGYPYTVSVTPNWNTTVWVTTKGYASFVVNFGTAAPAAAAIDWNISRN